MDGGPGLPVVVAGGDIARLDVVRAVAGELITLRGESLDGLDRPGPAAGLSGAWRRVESDAAAVLGGLSLASLLLSDAREQPSAIGAA
ncbi:hypothetical protein ABZY45_18035 [Streptomyces sp. NPDC006516]|uniref:hypothetical protein n=1 Tax=Streptomyces sp. NPDC006516 TaxID=3154309 RepID=UPI0033A8819D